jgi:hypothetical protein
MFSDSLRTPKVHYYLQVADWWDALCVEVGRMSSSGRPTSGASPICAEVDWAGCLLTFHRKNKAAYYTRYCQGSRTCKSKWDDLSDKERKENPSFCIRLSCHMEESSDELLQRLQCISGFYNRQLLASERLRARKRLICVPRSAEFEYGLEQRLHWLSFPAVFFRPTRNFLK